MENYLKNPIRKLFSNGASKRFLSIFLLISIAVFLVFPKICLADEFENITPREAGKYLELPARKVENLIHSLINLFNSQWMNRVASAYATAEKMAVPNIMRGAVRVQALNHLLVDAPIEITWEIIKNATKIAKVFLTKDPSVLLEELEKESVKKATEYGMKVLLQNEIRVTPGAINFKYDLKKGGIREVIFQYVVVYKPIDAKSGKLVIRFYSPNYLEIPKNQGNITGTTGVYTELTHDLPPFIVDIQGMVENYQWVGTPSMKIDFPPSVPDFGIKPLSFWERNFLKPIKTTIKDIEVIITKVTGKSPRIVENLFNIPKTVINIWNEIKSTFSEINPFSPATLVQTPAVEEEKPPVEVGQDIGQEVGQEVPEEKEEIREEMKPEVKVEEKPKPEERPKQLTLEEMQEILDDISERIDKMSQEVAKLVKEKGIKEKEKTEEEEKDEEIEELEEKEDDACFKSVNINTASKKELQKIIGVGPVLAQRIIGARPFYSLNDLLKVKGIGPATLQKIIAQACAYVDESYSKFAGSETTGGGSSGGSGGSGYSPSPTYSKILISEIQISPIEERFIELYNPNDQTVNLTGWYMQRKTVTGATWGSLVTKTNFENKTIQPYSYFLIARSPTLNPDILIENLTLTEDNSIVLKNPKGEIVDEISWGEIQEGFSYGQIWDESANKYLNGWEIQIPTPKTQNQSPASEPEPEEPEPEQPQLPQTVVINEIAWMGTKANSSDEWIEFYNPGDSEVDIADWSIYGADTGECLNFSDADDIKTTIISPSGYLIYAGHETGVQESNGASIVDIWDATIGMNNNSPGQLILYDALDCQGNVVDIANQSTGNWFAGKASPDYISMERISPQESGSNSENWQDNNLIIVNGMDNGQNQILGTPKAKNSVTYQAPITLPPVINWNLTLTPLYSPYIVQATTIIGQNATLRIDPGVVIKFMSKEGNNDSQLWILGTLKAGDQEESEQIVFTSFLDDEYGGDTNQDGDETVPYPGAWKWILFGSPEPNIPPTLDSELVNVLIRYGDTYDAGVIKVEKGSSITIKNSRLEKNKRGIWLVSSPSTVIDEVEFVDNDFLAVEIQNGGSPTIRNSNFEGKEGDQIGIIVGGGTAPLIENNFFTKNETPILVEIGSAPVLRGNRGENNQLNGIIMSPSGCPYPEGTNLSWKFNEDFPYIIEDSWRVYSGVTLKIEPGTVIKFGSLSARYWNFQRDAYFKIQGNLLAEGTNQAPIIFTSLRDDEYGGDTVNNDDFPTTTVQGSPPSEGEADWKNIQIKSNSVSRLKWVKIRYSGADGNEPLSIEEGANVAKDDSTITIEP